MNPIEQMLTGQMEMREFVTLLQSDSELQHTISKLVPQDAIANPNHTYWTHIYYNGLSKNNFDYYQFILSLCHFDNSIGDNLDLFSLLYRGYCYHHPELCCTNKYHEAFHMYLDVIQDTFEGPEVNHVVEQIINDTITIKPKSKRLKEAKAKVKAHFHIEDKHRPRWIQGPEWPMGIDSPMQYVGRKRISDGVEYSFVDVTTGATRIVTQYY